MKKNITPAWLRYAGARDRLQCLARRGQVVSGRDGPPSPQVLQRGSAAWYVGLMTCLSLAGPTTSGQMIWVVDGWCVQGLGTEPTSGAVITRHLTSWQPPSELGFTGFVSCSKAATKRHWEARSSPGIRGKTDVVLTSPPALDLPQRGGGACWWDLTQHPRADDSHVNSPVCGSFSRLCSPSHQDVAL